MRVTFLERKVTKRTSSQKDYKSSRIGSGHREDFERSISSIVFRVKFKAIVSNFDLSGRRGDTLRP